MTKPIDTDEIKDRLHKCDVRELEGYIYYLCDEIDRLRGEKQTPHGKMVLVKVAVAVDNRGRWAARGSSQVTHEDSIGIAQGLVDVGEACFTLTATLPVPAEVEVVARVEGE